MQDETKAALVGQIDSLSYTFLKLGGSLITEKSRPRTPRLEALARLSQEKNPLEEALGEVAGEILRSLLRSHRHWPRIG